MTNGYRQPLVFVPVRHAGRTIRHIAHAPHRSYTLEYLDSIRVWETTCLPVVGERVVLGQAQNITDAERLAQRHSMGLS